MAVQVHLKPEVERALRGRASTMGVTLEAYLDDLVTRAARDLPIAQPAEPEEQEGEAEHPWRGVFVLPRPHRPLFRQHPDISAAKLPDRPAACNMNWHRVDADDE
jgi:hypothetical protein